MSNPSNLPSPAGSTVAVLDMLDVQCKACLGQHRAHICGQGRALSDASDLAAARKAAAQAEAAAAEAKLRTQQRKEEKNSRLLHLLVQHALWDPSNPLPQVEEVPIESWRELLTKMGTRSASVSVL